jgi:hypothetical protein
MAAGSVTLFHLAKKKLLDGTIDLDGHTFKVVLCTSAQALAANFAGSSTDCRLADLTAQLATANGYTNGGATLGSITLNQSSGTVTFDAADVVWTLSGSITAKYAVIYDDTVVNDPLIGFIDLDTGGGSVSPLPGTFTIQWNASGIFTAT